MGISKKNKKNNLKNFKKKFGCLILEVKKMESKKPQKEKTDFDIKSFNSYKSCQLDIKNLQKISEKVEQTGLIALVGLSKKIVSFYNDVATSCEKNSLKTTDYFNLTSIRKYLYELVDYPQQQDADGKPVRNYVFENAVSRSIKLALVLINKDKTHAEIKNNVVYAKSNTIYPHLKTSGNGDIKFTKNPDESLIKVSTRGLEMLWSKIAPAKTNKVPKVEKEVKILDTFKNIKSILNTEILTRQKNVNYFIEKYGLSEIEQLKKIAQYALRIVEQKSRDDKNFDTDGNIKDSNIINVKNVEFKVFDAKNQSIAKVS